MFAKIDKVLADNGVNIRENPSRQIGEGCAIAIYLVHQRVGQDVIDELNRLEGVIRAQSIKKKLHEISSIHLCLTAATRSKLMFLLLLLDTTKKY